MCYRLMTICFNSKIHIMLISVFFLLIFTASASASVRNVTLSWDENSEPDIDHYIVYWGLNSGDYTENSGNIGLDTQYTALIPEDGTYFFAVTAVDEAGLESDFSNEVSTEQLAASISFNSNWNLISAPAGQQSAHVEDILDDVMDDIISVWAFDGNGWQVYDPENPNNPNCSSCTALTYVEPGQGLWVNMRKSRQLPLPEDVPDSIALSAGMNLVGFSSASSQSISQALASISGNVEHVWAYQNGKWKAYDPENINFSDLTTMDPGYGFWIEMSDSDTWQY